MQKEWLLHLSIKAVLILDAFIFHYFALMKSFMQEIPPGYAAPYMQAGKRGFLVSTIPGLTGSMLDAERLLLNCMNSLILNVWNNSYVSTCSAEQASCWIV